MKLRVSLQNEGGELDHRIVEGADEMSAGEAAKAALLEMLEDVPYLAIGDKITVTSAP
jgi:hypothetical protein